jgi:hypothetical protein
MKQSDSNYAPAGRRSQGVSDLKVELLPMFMVSPSEACFFDESDSREQFPTVKLYLGLVGEVYNGYPA